MLNMHTSIHIYSLVLCVFLTGCAVGGSGARVVYKDRNGDGIVDSEYHAYGGADLNWELRDTDFDGRYDKKIRYGYTRVESVVDEAVPTER
jgi:hypothetical protein